MSETLHYTKEDIEEALDNASCHADNVTLTRERYMLEDWLTLHAALDAQAHELAEARHREELATASVGLWKERAEQAEESERHARAVLAAAENDLRAKLEQAERERDEALGLLPGTLKGERALCEEKCRCFYERTTKAEARAEALENHRAAESLANAHLIASAPEAFAFLFGVIRDLESERDAAYRVRDDAQAASNRDLLAKREAEERFQLLEWAHREVCTPLQEVCQRDHLGLGGENVAEVLVEAYEQQKAALDAQAQRIASLANNSTQWSRTVTDQNGAVWVRLDEALALLARPAAADRKEQG